MLHGAEIAAFKGFTLIGNGAPQRDAAMIVTDGRITWVGPAALMKIPPGRHGRGAVRGNHAAGGCSSCR